jgi:phage protein D
MAVIDLSQLPAPQIVDVPDFETLLVERKAAFVALYPADEQAAVARTLVLESEPITKQLQESTYREMLLRQRINEAAQAVMVAYALGGDLEQLAANYNVKRLTVTPADTDAVPPVAAVMESDEALRLRVPAAFEGLSVAGPTAAYEFHARSADGRVADASATSPAPAEVVLTVLSREGDGKADNDLLTVVEKALNSESVRPVADRLTIRARSADFRETMNTRREKSWHQTTVGEVVKEIAARHNLKLALGKDLTDKALDHLDQTNESDASFLMKLARQYGAIASVKDENLLFIRQGQGRTASGKPLPVITITRKAGDGHRFTLADRGAYTGVIASWLHTREPKKKETTQVKRRRKKTAAPKEPEAKHGDYLVGTDENVLVLNRTYANRSNAERAAKAQWERLQRGVASFSLQLAEGRADLYTEMPVKVSGFKQPIDDAEWTITTLTHTVSPDNGFTTSLDLEVKIDEFEIE